jgi:hypothetical protein
MDYFLTDTRKHFEAILSALEQIDLESEERQDILHEVIALTKSVRTMLFTEYSSHLHTECSESKEKWHCCQYAVGAHCSCTEPLAPCFDCTILKIYPFLVKDMLSTFKKDVHGPVSEKIDGLIATLGFTNNIIWSFMAHQTRKRIQDKRLSQVKVDLPTQECLCVVDFAMRLLPKSNEESSQEFFGKRGISYLSAGCVHKSEDGKCISTTYFDFIFPDSCSQTAISVMPIMFRLLRLIKQKFPWITSVKFQMDNACCFQSLPLILFCYSMNEYFENIKISTFIFTEAQCGKTATDCHFSFLKLMINQRVDLGSDARTALEIYHLLEEQNMSNMSLSLVSTKDFEIHGDFVPKKLLGPEIKTRKIAEVSLLEKSLVFQKHSNLPGATIEFSKDAVHQHFINIKLLDEERSHDKIFANIQDIKPKEEKNVKIYVKKPNVGKLDLMLEAAVKESFFSEQGDLVSRGTIGERFPAATLTSPYDDLKLLELLTSHAETTNIVSLPLLIFDLFLPEWAMIGKIDKKPLSLPDGVKQKLFQFWSDGNISGRKISPERACETLQHQYKNDIYAQIAIAETPIRRYFGTLSSAEKRFKKMQFLSPRM